MRIRGSDYGMHLNVSKINVKFMVRQAQYVRTEHPN